MRKFLGVVSVAVLAVVCARALQGHQARLAAPALSEIERQTLRDALNSDYSDLNGDVKQTLSNLKEQSSGMAALPGAVVGQSGADAAAAKAQNASSAIAKCATPQGFFAGSDYKQYWTRDVGYSVEVLIKHGYAGTVAVHLEDLLKHQQPTGAIPTEIHTLRGLIQGLEPHIWMRNFEYRGLRFLKDRKDLSSDFHGSEADSFLIFLVTAKTYESMTGKDTFSTTYKDQIAKLIKYVESLKDPSGLIPGSAWFDAMINYHGKFTLNNQVWLYKMYKAYGMQEQARMTQGLLEMFWDAQRGYYVDYKGGDHFDTLSNAMLLNEGVVPPDRAKSVLDNLSKSFTKFGYVNLYPTYDPGLCSERVHEYQNSTIWPFIELRVAQAFARFGQPEKAAQIKALMEARQGVNEWYSPVDGHPDGSKNQLWTASAYLGVSDLAGGSAAN